MADEGFVFAKCAETLQAYEDRAEREWLCRDTRGEARDGAAHRLLAIQYDADADDLRREIAAKA